MCRWYVKPLLSVMPGKTTLTTLSFLMSLLSFGLQAQSSEPHDSVQQAGGDKTDDDSSLDLFDQDTELTKKGWLQFYAEVGFMRLEAAGSFSLRLPIGKQVTIIDFDRAGLDDNDNSYWVSLNWRSANSRWGAWFGSWQYDVVGSHLWEGGLPVDDDLDIPLGALVTSDFDTRWYIIEATYSLFRSPTIDAGIGFGFHMVDLDTRATVSVQIGDQEFFTSSGSLEYLAPLPNALAYIHWKFAPKWNLVGRIGYFGLDYNEFSGSMTNAHVMTNYQLSPRWTLGAGFQFVDLDLDIEKDNYIEVYDAQFSGPMAFLKYSF